MTIEVTQEALNAIGENLVELCRRKNKMYADQWFLVDQRVFGIEFVLAQFGITVNCTQNERGEFTRVMLANNEYPVS